MEILDDSGRCWLRIDNGVVSDSNGRVLGRYERERMISSSGVTVAYVQDRVLLNLQGEHIMQCQADTILGPDSRIRARWRPGANTNALCPAIAAGAYYLARIH